MMSEEINRWKGFLIGMMGSAAGLAAMRAYWQNVAPKVQEIDLGGQDIYPQSVDLDDISVTGQQAQDDEGSTAAIGRLVYQSVVGKEPTKETKELLSYLVHWGYGLVQGGLYGAWRSGKGRRPNLLSSVAFGTGLWLLGDEVAVPMLGLQGGPTAVAPKGHINRWGAHLAYSLTTAVTSRILHKIL